jgi:hypothetical protein
VQYYLEEVVLGLGAKNHSAGDDQQQLAVSQSVSQPVSL